MSGPAWSRNQRPGAVRAAAIKLCQHPAPVDRAVIML